MTMNKEVVVGLSGGVDSAAAVFFLQRQGYGCTGLHMRLADLPDCDWKRQRDCGAEVAESMKIPFYVTDERGKFKEFVADYFVREYQEGRTPNPCIVCNEKIRWDVLMRWKDRLGIPFAATGHYARIKRVQGWNCLAVPKDRKKDQTYFLYRLSQKYLERTLFPLGDYKKQDVRETMKELGFGAGERPDSQEICFLPENTARDFLFRHMAARPGEMVNQKGEVLGRHRGIGLYTVGQRKGLGIVSDKPLYVKRILPDCNQILLAEKEALYITEIKVHRTVWMAKEQGELYGAARVRNTAPLVPCRAVKEEDGSWLLIFEQTIWAPAPGQSAVFYKGGRVVFGGIITEI